MKNKPLILFVALTAIWYFITFLVPYNELANSLGIVNLGNGHSWPLAFFVMDVIVIASIVLFIVQTIRSLKKKELHWLLLGVLLFYPLITVWATLQDLVVSR